ncbi:DUF5949 family protein [Streptomyces filamentosus]|uniref:Uncharacterized protein n=1 Tax=Streptomyces filamentosus TaxID=67294 RepID=A0A919BF64_STRFL|nr:DUF5949 family protein [Streptomyces filamentosus]GHF87201.1 hypothetical protein GCM10017667_14670 [Streptomyces filamentosus]
MTTPHVLSEARSLSPLGTLTVIPWSSEATADSAGTPFLMAYSLGDGRDGPEAGQQAMRAALESMGLSVGDRLFDLEKDAGISATLLVEGGSAALTLPFLKVQCPVPAEWQAAARESGKVYFLCSVRPWAEAVPGQPVDEDRLRAFVSDEEMLADCAHVLLPVRRLQG